MSRRYLLKWIYFMMITVFSVICKHDLWFHNIERFLPKIFGFSKLKYRYAKYLKIKCTLTFYKLGKRLILICERKEYLHFLTPWYIHVCLWSHNFWTLKKWLLAIDTSPYLEILSVGFDKCMVEMIACVYFLSVSSLVWPMLHCFSH